MINLTIDGQNVQVEEGTSVLEAARTAGVHIPTLCYLPEVQAIGACRVCLVEVQGNKNLQASCTLPVSERMVVKTSNDRVRKARKFFRAAAVSGQRGAFGRWVRGEWRAAVDAPAVRARSRIDA